MNLYYILYGEPFEELKSLSFLGLNKVKVHIVLRCKWWSEKDYATFSYCHKCKMVVCFEIMFILQFSFLWCTKGYQVSLKRIEVLLLTRTI